MPEQPPTSWQKTVEVANVIGAVAFVGGAVVTIFAFVFSWPGWAIGSSVTAIVLGALMMFARLVSTQADAPIVGIGEWKEGYASSSKAGYPLLRPSDLPRVIRTERPSGGLSLGDIEREYELKKLEPNFVDRGSEYVEAHNDSQGVLIRGASADGAATFHALVRAFGNQHPRNKVRSLRRVSFRLNFICFDRDKPQSVNTDRGAWLNEANTEIEFAAHCPAKRAVVVTVEGSENQVYVVRRDSDSYKGIHPLREQLAGSVYTVFLTLLDESRNSKSFQYILEVIREPAFDLRLTDAASWKVRHLGKFFSEGLDCLKKVNEIAEDASQKVPFDKSPPSLASLGASLVSESKPPEKLDYFDTINRRSAIEKEQEEKLIPILEDWEARIYDFLDLYIGTDQRDQFRSCVPTFEAGLNRELKGRRWSMRLSAPDGKPLLPEAADWKLYDAVNSRLKKLEEITNGL